MDCIFLLYIFEGKIEVVKIQEFAIRVLWKVSFHSKENREHELEHEF